MSYATELNMKRNDIKRLLAGRKIIDSIQKPDDVELTNMHATLKAIKDYTTPDAVSLRKEIDALYETERQSILAAQDQLHKLGFKDDSEFFEFNHQMCLDDIKARVKVTRFPCTGCPTKKCIELYKNNACFYRPNSNIGDSPYELRLRLRKKSKSTSYEEVRICPEGYGYNYKRIREPLFDLSW
ncbi:hypothetical protein ES708_01505 [subsurface metagenome]